MVVPHLFVAVRFSPDSRGQWHQEHRAPTQAKKIMRKGLCPSFGFARNVAGPARKYSRTDWDGTCGHVPDHLDKVVHGACVGFNLGPVIGEDVIGLTAANMTGVMMAIRKDVVQSQPRRSGLGQLVAKHSPFPSISSYFRPLLMGVHRIRTAMNGENESRNEESNTSSTAPHATDPVALESRPTW